MALMINNLTGFGGGKLFSRPLTYTYLQTATTSTNATVTTFSSQNLGTADTNRYIIAVLNMISVSTTLPTISSITIGGVSASVATGTSADGTFNDTLSTTAIALVPTGTTGDVVITVATAQTSAVSCSLYSVVDENVQLYGSWGNRAENPVAYPVEIPAGAVMMAGLASNETVDGTTWTNLTEDVDGAWATENKNYSAASRSSSVSLNRFDVEALSTSSTEQCMAASAYAKIAPCSEVPLIFSLSSQGSATNATSYSLTAQPCGIASADRIIMITAAGYPVTGGASKGVSSITINGNATTQAVNSLTSASNDLFIASYYLAVPSGTTCDFVVTMTEIAGACATWVHSIYGSGGAPIATNVAESLTTTVAPSVTLPSGAAIVGVIVSDTPFGTTSTTDALVDFNTGSASGEGLFYCSYRSVSKPAGSYTNTVTFDTAVPNKASIVAW